MRNGRHLCAAPNYVLESAVHTTEKCHEFESTKMWFQHWHFSAPCVEASEVSGLVKAKRNAAECSFGKHVSGAMIEKTSLQITVVLKSPSLTDSRRDR